MSVALSLTELGCVRGDRLLFSGLDLELQAKGAALVTGPNGAGKTSLLRIIAGLLPAQSGSVTHSGEIAFLSDQSALDRDLPLAKALAYWARLDRQPLAAIDEALSALAISHLADIPVRMLSTGQLKRAAIARVIVSGADIWLLDEPANGLDTDSRARLEQVIAEHRAAGRIAIVATHQPIELPDAQAITIGDAA